MVMQAMVYVPCTPGILQISVRNQHGNVFDIDSLSFNRFPK